MNPSIIQSFNWFVDLSFGYPYESPYKFNGKEKDEETGYNNYEARYYGSDIGIFLSVDPLMDKFPHLTPYHYCYNNPLNFIDPTGMEAGWYVDEEGTVVGKDKTDDDKLYLVYGNDLSKVKKSNVPFWSFFRNIVIINMI